nr:type II toxin-antitoxin system VapC family toxin [Pseudopedobacter sp.]
MILCDTNILIEIYKNNSEIIETIKQIGQENIFVSDVTCAELLYGARNKKELKTIRSDLNKLNVLPIQSFISSLSVELVEKYCLSHKLSLPDALIASTALHHNIELFTLNTKDFKFIEGIKLFSQEK